MQGRQERHQTVPTSSLKPFHLRPPDPRHPTEDEFVQQVWSADLGLAENSTVAAPLYPRLDRQEVANAAGVSRWGYQGRYQDGQWFPWLSEVNALDSFAPLQLGSFHTLRSLYHRTSSSERKTSGRTARYLSRADALRLFPIRT